MLSILLLAFQYKPVQTWAAKKATAYLSEELHTTIDIKSLYIEPFRSVILEDLYVLDKQKDTLLRTPKLTVRLSRFSLFSSIKNRVIYFADIQLDNGSFYLKKQKDTTTNLQFILDYFNSGDTTKSGKPWTLDFERIGINNLRFRYKNMLKDSLVKGINFNDLDIRNFSTIVRNMDINNHIFKAGIRNLTFREKSGFYVKNLSSNATIDTNQVLLQRLYLQTKNSVIKDYLRLGFNSFDDFGDFEKKIMMDGDFKNAHVSSKDIDYFSSLDKVQFELGVSGRIKGRVGNLKAKNMLITAAQGTYIKGNFNLKGLPDWENTLMNLDIEQVATNKKDLDYLLARLTGKPRFKAPDIISKFGNVNFSGSFNGLQNDFVAYGTFKTNLGRFDTDINLKINKAGIPAYSGKVTTNQFDLGTLISNKIIGRTTFTAQVKGSGDELNNLDITANAKVKNITFKGYSYNNVVIDGMFRKKVIDGLISINDRNVKLDMNGSINLNKNLPVYNFAGTITNANLNKLMLIKDTVTVTTTLRTNFSGDNLDNLNGNIFLSSTRVVDPRNNYMLDSLYLVASGEGNSRLLDFQSDAADGSIKGSYNLATLPSYFKSVVKKYIPSLKTDITPPKPQNFEFNFKLKNADALLAIFVPKLKIPDGGNVIGQFNSSDQTATLNGFIKTVEYDGMVFHDVILDESTPTGPAMWINISINKVDITDSLYIKDINITNFLQRDSLNFNVKMSDKNAANQLDLYGLVEFGRDTTAKLKLLPSEVVLENEKWKLQEMVRIRFLDNKTQVSGFDLSNGEQRVKIDGFISDKAEDKLNVVFQRFRMSTLNTLTKPSGVFLKGALNGKVILSTLTKKPGIDADLNIDTLMMNQTLVGNVKVISNLDNEGEKILMKLNILNRGLETMDIEGSYSLAEDTGEVFDFDINMNQTEAIIFTPFINNLVSDVKGTVSTSLKLTGSLKNPQLNGDVTLNNTGITVNYLKTAYTLNDKLTVENSIIKLNKLVIKDTKKGQGIANGTVDLNNIANPELNIDVTADNLMALNTTFKDNHIYFGTAYGTGKFSFTGPVDNMRIDIKATTQEGTVFNIPLNTSSTAGDYDFIRFVSHNDTTQTAEDLTKKFNGVTLNFDLSADEKTIVKIITDYGQLEGRGITNNLKLNINSLGDFEMFGDFLISSGKFEFTAQNFISKNFAVNQGGTIRWTGDPSNAEINLRAVYEVRTSVADLYTAAGLTSPRGDVQVLVQAQLILTKSLLLPDIDFDFNFPTDPSIKEDVSTYLADNNNRSQQALSIIVRRKFAAGSGGGNLDQQVLSTAGDAVSEFAFNKLNSFIAQSNIKNVDISIRSLSEASASIRLFNDRLQLNGSLFNNSGTNNLFDNNNNRSLFNTNANNLRGDFEALYRIRKDGNLTARYSYRILSGTASSTFNPLDVQYVNGLGLVYQRDFDTIGEFLRNLFRQGRRTSPPVNPAPTAPSSPVGNFKLKDEDEIN